ncbi:type II secretion system secretin GspD [Limnobaculum parvum]|uniref:Type II secretion system protein GspD n=1 Tax=Limnobaculum parvum TaxID=2172103 RepID=A0A2Y9TYA5_9GAMM|nr:type II secretion system secretin GspD [Limnobaculum parvum]AWH88374.1 type II secretion system protein GspD [Limnobaculum parvum]
MKRKICARSVLALLFLYSGHLIAADFSANFKDTDIREFIDVASRNLNKTILVDPAVQGKVSVRTYDLLTEDQYYQFFLSVLDLYGFSAIPMDNGMIKIVRSSTAKTAGVPVADTENPGKGDEIITRVVQMENVPVRDLAPLLRQLNDASGVGNVVNYEPSNVLLLTGKASSINRLVDLVHRVDASGVQQRETIPLQYGSAKEISDMLNNLSNEEQKGQSAPQLTAKVVADTRTNTLVLSGSSQAREKTRSLIKKLDRNENSQGNTRVFYLKYANAVKIAAVLTGIGDKIQTDKGGSAKASASLSSKNDLNITADDQTNSLVITAQPDVMQSLSQVIDKLDIRRAQVLVEAIIVEVQDGAGLNLGVQWATSNGISQFTNTGIPIFTAKRGKDQLDIDGRFTATNPLTGVLGGYNGLATGFFNGDFGALLTALASDNKSDILSTPSVVTLDNREASFNVGQDVPVLSGSQSNTSGDNVFSTVERKTVGTKLKVTPLINDDNSVQMKIEQEVSSVDPTSAQSTLGPTFNTRTINNEVLVRSGQTVVLGGLVEDFTTQTVSKVPLLGDIPLIGQLFRSTSNTKAKRNLMVFIRPTVIRNDADYNYSSKVKYNKSREDQQYRIEENKIGIVPPIDPKVLPEYPDNLSPGTLGGTGTDNTTQPIVPATTTPAPRGRNPFRD